MKQTHKVHLFIFPTPHIKLQEIFVVVDLLFYVPLKNISHIWRRKHYSTGERLQNLGIRSVLRAFEQGEIFIVPH
jgi:hypothetical protein